jgi:sugar-specific transcriptional regulator TrmB
MEILNRLNSYLGEGNEEYQKYFQAKLKKFGVKSPSELSDEKKKEFFDEVDKGWKGKDEKAEKNESVVNEEYGIKEEIADLISDLEKVPRLSTSDQLSYLKNVKKSIEDLIKKIK